MYSPPFDGIIQKRHQRIGVDGPKDRKICSTVSVILFALHGTMFREHGGIPEAQNRANVGIDSLHA